METRYKLFPACRKNAKASEHQRCTGAYFGKYKDQDGKIAVAYNNQTTEFFEVRWQCSCPHHRMANASVQQDFFESEKKPEVPRFEQRTEKQGKLF